MKDLETLCAKIDAIDRELVRLFEARMNVVLGVAAYKLAHGLPILNAGREQQVLDKCCANGCRQPWLSAAPRRTRSSRNIRENNKSTLVCIIELTERPAVRIFSMAGRSIIEIHQTQEQRRKYTEPEAAHARAYSRLCYIFS